MIILITGATHTGKTVWAQKLMEKYKIPYLSVDHLKMGLIRSGMTDLTPEDDDRLTEFLWPIVREMIKTAIENRQSMIVEGSYLPFDWKKDFTGKYLKDIRFLCLVFTERYIRTHYDDIVAHACDIEQRLCDRVTEEELILENRRFLEGFRARGFDCEIIDEEYPEIDA